MLPPPLSYAAPSDTLVPVNDGPQALTGPRLGLSTNLCFRSGLRGITLMMLLVLTDGTAVIVSRSVMMRSCLNMK